MTGAGAVTLCGRALSKPGHICAFFDSRAEEYETLLPYFKEGIEQGEQVINIVDREKLGDHRARLEADGIAVDEASTVGSLKVFASEDTYTSKGRFAAAGMYDLLQGALAGARRKGRRVRASGVMDWASRGHAGTEELIEYEARVNVLVPIFDCTLLCVYDLNAMSGRMVMDILLTHPFVIHRRELRENPYYRPPIDVLGDLLRPTQLHAGGPARPS